MSSEIYDIDEKKIKKIKAKISFVRSCEADAQAIYVNGELFAEVCVEGFDVDDWLALLEKLVTEVEQIHADDEWLIKRDCQFPQDLKKVKEVE